MKKLLCLLLACVCLLGLTSCKQAKDHTDPPALESQDGTIQETVFDYDSKIELNENISSFYLENPLNLSKQELDAALQTAASNSVALTGQWQSSTCVETYPIYGKYMAYTSLVAYVFYNGTEAESLAVINIDQSNALVSIDSLATKEQTNSAGTIAQSALFWLRYSLKEQVQTVGFYVRQGYFYGSLPDQGYLAERIVYANGQPILTRCTEKSFAFDGVFPFETVEEGHQAYQDYQMTLKKSASFQFENGLYTMDKSYDKKYLEGETLYCEWVLTEKVKVRFSFYYEGENSDFADIDTLMRNEWNWLPKDGTLIVEDREYSLVINNTKCDLSRYEPLLNGLGEPKRLLKYKRWDNDEIVIAEWNPEVHVSVYYFQDWPKIQLVLRSQ